MIKQFLSYLSFYSAAFNGRQNGLNYVITYNMTKAGVEDRILKTFIIQGMLLNTIIAL